MYPDGSPVKATSDQIQIVAEDVTAFMTAVNEDGTYKGTLKLDVAKPQTRNVAGKIEVVKAPRIFLTATPFSQRKNSFTADNRNASREAISRLFGKDAQASQTPAAKPATSVKDGMVKTS